MTYIPSPTKDFTAFTAAANATPASKPHALATIGIEAKAEAKTKRGFWAAMFDAIWSARQRQADAEIARYLAMSGGKLTDSTEREIARRLSGDSFRLR